MQYTERIEMPYPPTENLVTLMRSRLEEKVPVGERLHGLVNQRHIGLDIGEDFKPCYVLEVTFTTTEIEPKVWQGED